jgi:Type ISP C-terminal specificity domain/N-6 DNA Methylase
MSRTRTRPPTMAGIARELARQARELGGSQAALAVFRRFLEQQGASLHASDTVEPGSEDRGQRSEVSRAQYSVLSTQYQVHGKHRQHPPIANSQFWTSDFDTSIVQLDRSASDAVVAEGRLWELLLRELAPDRRHRRGMFFTPRPLVQFIVRSVRERLDELGPPRRLHVIDPACGYGGFLIEATRHIAAGRFTGFEVDGPTCEVVRLLAAREGRLQQPDISHVNPLLEGESLREAVLGSKNEALIPVIVGNPPWSNFGRLNRGPWIDGLLAEYRSGLGERKSNLADDSIKFLRWAQYWVEQAGAGIVGFVTPNTWLTGLTHRRMRESLLDTFDELAVLDLHGEPDDAGDENVFGVRSGVAIMLGVRFPIRGEQRAASYPASCRALSLRGSRMEKFAALENHTFGSLDSAAVRPAPPDWFLAASQPGNRPPSTARGNYASYWPLDRIFRFYTSGVQTKNDAVFVGFTREQVAEQVRASLARQADPPDFDAGLIQPYLLAPFDRRFIYYDPRLIGRARYAVMRHMLAPNLGLVFMRQSANRGEYDHFLAVDCLVSDRVFYSRHGAPFLAPLWLADREGAARAGQAWEGEAPAEPGSRIGGTGKEANFSADFLATVTSAIGDAPDPLGLFQYLYAIAHCPTYRSNFADELRRGFPRFPLPRDNAQFDALCELGRRLIQLHTEPSYSTTTAIGVAAQECSGLQSASTASSSRFAGNSGANRHRKALGASNPPVVAAAQTNHSRGARTGLHLGFCDAGDSFHLGGYEVLKRWARPRRVRGLSADEERELARLAWIGIETRRIMQEIGQSVSP